MTAQLSELPEVRLRDIPQAFIDALKVRFGANCSTAEAVRAQHGRDESAFTHVPAPTAVVFAESSNDVSDAVRLAHQYPIPE